MSEVIHEGKVYEAKSIPGYDGFCFTPKKEELEKGETLIKSLKAGDVFKGPFLSVVIIKTNGGQPPEDYSRYYIGKLAYSQFETYSDHGSKGLSEAEMIKWLAKNGYKYVNNIVTGVK